MRSGRTMRCSAARGAPDPLGPRRGVRRARGRRLPRLGLGLALTTTGCAAATLPAGPADTAAPDAGAVPRSVVSLLDDPPSVGARVLLGPVTPISGAEPATGAVYVQDPSDGLGLRLLPGDVLGTDWPPVRGSSVQVRAVWAGEADDPVLFVDDPADVTVLDEGPVDEVVLPDPPVDDPVRAFTLVRHPGLEVTSRPDPGGRADTSLGLPLEDRFGVGLPGLGSLGRLTALVMPTGALVPRTADDWEGTRRDPPPVATTLAEVVDRVHPAGTWVTFEAVQASSWSRGGRYVLIQDDAGRGLWVDAEGFDVVRGAVGERATWTGEVRRTRDLRWLRTWVSRGEVVEEGVPTVVSEAWRHGDVGRFEVSGLGPADAQGERTTAEGWLLDDRFVDLAGLADPTVVWAGVDRRHAGQVRLVVFAEGLVWDGLSGSSATPGR